MINSVWQPAIYRVNFSIALCAPPTLAGWKILYRIFVQRRYYSDSHRYGKFSRAQSTSLKTDRRYRSSALYSSPIAARGVVVIVALADVFGSRVHIIVARRVTWKHVDGFKCAKGGWREECVDGKNEEETDGKRECSLIRRGEVNRRIFPTMQHSHV